MEAPGLACVIREQAPQAAGRVSKSAPLLCPSLALPPPLSLRHPFPHPFPSWKALAAASSSSILGTTLWTNGPPTPEPSHLRVSGGPGGAAGRRNPWAQPVTQENGQGRMEVLPPSGMPPASGKGGGWSAPAGVPGGGGRGTYLP